MSRQGRPPAGPVDPRVVELLDPVAEVLRGALPYADRPAAVRDDQPVPGLRVRRVLTPAGLQLSVTSHLDDEFVSGSRVEVDRLPLDRSITPVRPRVYPAAMSFLVVGDAAGDAGDALYGVVPDGVVLDHVGLAGPGPGRQDIVALLERARAHRLVVIDVSAERDPALVAALVLHLAAAGIPCWVAQHTARRLELLSPELRSSLTFDLAAAGGDELQLAAVTARQRRDAWAGHDLRLGWHPEATGDTAGDTAGDIGTDWPASLRPVPFGAVTVVLVSRRPYLVPSALAMIAAQQGVDVEVVVGLHGASGADAIAPIDAERRRLHLDGRVLAVPGAVPFGTVLNVAAGHGTGRFVLKWDDDDLYGPTHVLDLLVAQRQTGAGLVGKSSEFIYFEDEGETIWRLPHRAESHYLWIAGGTFLTPRSVLDEVGGYPDITRAVDHHLKLRIHESGLGVFRTHGFGFVLRRHAHGHTWEVAGEVLRQKAERTFRGLPEIIGLGDAARFQTLPDAVS